MNSIARNLFLISALFLTALCSTFSHAVESTDKVVKPSTAQSNVLLMKELVDIPVLNRQRQIRLYLPPSYSTSKRRYPVIYMHDAQNLFDAATAYSIEWNVDETLNALAKSDKIEVIVVGIDNGQDKRMTELNAWDNKDFGKQEGKQYMEFIVKVLKPLIDQQYRTKTDRANTAMMGSSMGGLISHYAISQYPDVFGKAGIFSASYWAAPDVFEFIRLTPAPKDTRLYLMSGGNEGGGIMQAQETGRAYATMLATGHLERNIKMKIVPKGEHGEILWRAEFAEAIRWMFKYRR